MPTTLRLEDILDDLHDPRESVRERAARRLARLGRHGLTADQGLHALKASTLPYPPRRYPGDDTPVDLIRAVLQVPYPEYLPSVIQRYPLWRARARREVLALLTRVDDVRAAEAIMKILRRHARAGSVSRLPLGMYDSNPQYPEVFFPELLGYLDLPRLRFAVCEYALAFGTVHLIDPDILMPRVETFLALYRRRRDNLARVQRDEGVAWRWKPRYHRCRWQAGVLLDLLGHVTAPQVPGELRRALDEYSDPRLRLYALLSLLRQDQEVDPSIVAELAGCPETRIWLFDGLQKLERFALYPAEYRTQAALAESDLVNWLIHPYELGRAPEEIEFVQVIPFDGGADAAWLDYYLFRFRTDPPHWSARHGWMAGVSGPFLHKDTPAAQALGDTSSQFTPWDMKLLGEHVADVRQLMKTWRERHVAANEH